MPRQRKAPAKPNPGGGLSVLQVISEAVKGSTRVPADSAPSKLVARAMERLREKQPTFSSSQSRHGLIACVRNCELQDLVIPAAYFAFEGDTGTISVDGITEVMVERDRPCTLSNAPCQVTRLGSHVLVEFPSTPNPTNVGAQKQLAAAVAHVQSKLGMTV